MTIEAPTEDPMIKKINPITIRVIFTPGIFTGLSSGGGSVANEGKDL